MCMFIYTQVYMHTCIHIYIYALVCMLYISLPQRSVQRNRGNSTMGKTRDLFKKIRDAKGTFHAKMGRIKDRNGMDLTEAEDIKKRWQEYTEELYKMIFMSQITMTV